MARFTLLITAWKEHTKENWVRMIHTEARDAKSKENPPVELWGSEWSPLLSKLHLEPSCGLIQFQSQTWSTVYVWWNYPYNVYNNIECLRGLAMFCSINSACCQLLTRLCRGYRISLPFVRKDLLVSGKESLT